eukprot:gene17283-23835_t
MSSEGTLFKNADGVEISVIDFGGIKGLTPVYYSIMKQFEAWGYEIGKNAFAAPYDYRIMSKESLQLFGFIDELKLLIENAYYKNNESKVYLIGHSNGPPTLYSFLAAMSQPWKDQFIAGLVGLSGNYLGQMNAFLDFMDPDSTGEKAMINSWEGQYLSCPWGEYDITSGVTVITTYANQPSKTLNYTASIQDISSLLSSAGKDEWSKLFISLQSKMNRSAHPNVNSYCLYGSDVSTTYGFAYDGMIQESTHSATYNMDGDGNQDIIDNQFCQLWENTNESRKYITLSESFPGVQHMDIMIRDPK